MPPKSPSRIGPIKLKLSIASKPIVSTSPPFSTQTSMTRKGKEKAAKDDDEKLLVPKVELDDLEIESRALGRSSKQVILRTPELKQPYHESDTYSSVALPANGDRASLERSSRRGSSLDESSGSTTPAPCQHTVPPSPAPEPARHLAVSTTPQSAQDTPGKTVVKIPRTSGRTKGKRKKTATRPSAIPPRMLSANPSTPRLTPLPRLPTSTPATPEVHTVKLEPEMTEHAEADLVPLPLAPDVVQMSTPKEECDEVVTTGTETAKKGTKWGRLRKPLKEVFGKLIGELRRKDEYDLFGKPVNLKDFPEYVSTVGGEENMMDLGTMQSKMDHREYRDLNQVEADLRTLATAAQVFNPPGTIPHTSATRLLSHGLKLIERSRPLVRTPSPSPDPHQSERATSTTSGREMTAAVEETPVRRPISDIEPRSYTPEEMLVFPPNSLYALAVGWNLNGGRNVYLKSQIRGRERFVGKWRHWDLDGTRDLAEMDAPESEFLFAQMGHGSSVRVPDWKAMRKDAWWNGNSQGGSNRQPLQSYSNFPWRHTRRLGTYEWGVYPDINAEITYFSNSTRVADEHEVLSEHIRPMRPRHTAQSPNMTNIYDGPLGRRAADWLRDVCTGDVRGEAYLCSVERFVKGAMDSSKKSMSKTQDGGLRLDDYVFEKWHNGVLNSRPRLVIQKTLASLSSANDPASHNDPNRANLLALARGAYHRLVLRNLISPSNPLDIAILLREPSEFGLPGIGGKEGVISGLDWAANEITRMSSDLAAKSKSSKRARSPEVTASVKRVRVKLDTDVRSTGSSPLTAPPDSPPATNRSELILSTEAALRRLRLELVSLSKFYPLAGLKKMDKKQAERLLPENVRKIMSKTT